MIIRVITRVANPLVPGVKFLHDRHLRISWFAEVGPPGLIVVAGLGVTVNILIRTVGAAIFGVDAAGRCDLVCCAVLGEKVVTVSGVMVCCTVAVHGTQERIRRVRIPWFGCRKYRIRRLSVAGGEKYVTEVVGGVRSYRWLLLLLRRRGLLHLR